ncbi:hypothetical protein G6F24_014917 [Rhizopus arrhizus]|nr:hypothetical protein G6F24_014917 [Rhizopus arrhizus]
MRRTFAEGLFRRTQSVESAGTLAVRQVHIQCGLADEVAVAQAQLPARHATALNFDLGIVDEVVRFAVPAARVHAGLGMRIAEQHAGQAKLGVAAGAAVDIIFERTGNGLLIVVAAGVGTQQPRAQRHAVVRRPAVGATLAAIECRPAHVDVEQIAQAGRVVHRYG